MRLHARRLIIDLLRRALSVIDAAGPAWSKITPLLAPLPRAGPGAGISVLIPERGNPLLLGRCLESVVQACRRVTEPAEVVVVASGSPRSHYEELCSRYKSVRWIFSARPLWFADAVRKGLRVVRNGWVYLLNSDMELDPMALTELLPWRAAHVFAIASQIFNVDSSKRREETGWTKFETGDDTLEIFDAIPDSDLVCGTFYAGGGASLFQKSLLQRALAGSRAYRPFYWEDVEWGVRAWRCGFESLFCPKSKVRHHRRATNRLFFAEEEIDRIFRRNALMFELRNRVLDPSSHAKVVFSLHRLDQGSFREMMTPAGLAGILLTRLQYWRYRYRQVPLQCTWRKYYMKDWLAAARKPTVLLVSPYVIFPPSHGGAVRLHNLIMGISERFNIVLLSDEADGYTDSSFKYFARLSSVHLVSGRSGDAVIGRISRIESHFHANLATVMAMLLARYAPELVQVEFMELARLSDLRDFRRDSPPWILTLHDVWINASAGPPSYEDRYELALMRKFDALVVCSEEDARLIGDIAVHIVSNGADTHSAPYVPSPRIGPILFLGPFRYLPNLVGIREFLERVYPYLLVDFPEIRILVLGGDGAEQAASGLPCFAQPGITLTDYVDRPRIMLDECVLTINPLHGVRGSCLKIAESLAAGRVCVSTTEGARGFLKGKVPALVTADTVAEFKEPIRRLLADPDYRHSIEKPEDSWLYEYSWEASAGKMIDLYAQLLKRRPPESSYGAHTNSGQAERAACVFGGSARRSSTDVK